jgi:hypothetical protein
MSETTRTPRRAAPSKAAIPAGDGAPYPAPKGHP